MRKPDISLKQFAPIKLENYLEEWRARYRRPMSMSFDDFMDVLKAMPKEEAAVWELVGFDHTDVHFALRGGRFVTAVDWRAK